MREIASSFVVTSVVILCLIGLNQLVPEHAQAQKLSSLGRVEYVAGVFPDAGQDCFVVSASGPNRKVTATIVGMAGRFISICGFDLEFVGPVPDDALFTTTNLGNLSWYARKVPHTSYGAIYACPGICIQYPRPVKSSIPGVDVTFVSPPAIPGVSYVLNVYYRYV